MREKFLQQVDQILMGEGFTREDNIYTKIVAHTQPGAIVAVNGRPFQQPPQTIVNKFVITCLGEGWVADADEETNKIPFEQIRYEVFQNDNPMSIFEECLYYDEAYLIMNDFIKP